MIRKLTVQEIAQFHEDARVIGDFLARNSSRPVYLATSRIRKLAAKLMEVEVKVS